MTLKHSKYGESSLLDSILQEQAPAVKKEAAKQESYEVSGDLFNDVITLAHGLRSRGFVAEADALEEKLFLREAAKKKMEKAKQEKTVMDEAHPEGDVEVSPSQSGMGKVWTEQSAHREILEKIQKTPTGKYANTTAVAAAKFGREMAIDFGAAMSGPLGMDADDIIDEVEGHLSRALMNDARGYPTNVYATVAQKFKSLIGQEAAELAAQIVSDKAKASDYDMDEALRIMAGHILARAVGQMRNEYGREGSFASKQLDNLVKAAAEALGIKKEADSPLAGLPTMGLGTNTRVDDKSSQAPSIKNNVNKLIAELAAKSKSLGYTLDEIDLGGFSGEDYLAEHLEHQFSRLLNFSASGKVMTNPKTGEPYSFEDMVGYYFKEVRKLYPQIFSQSKIDLTVNNSKDDPDLALGKYIFSHIAGFAQKVIFDYTTKTEGENNRQSYAQAYNLATIQLRNIKIFIKNNKNSEDNLTKKKVAKAKSFISFFEDLIYEIKLAHKRMWSYKELLSSLKRHGTMSSFVNRVPTLDKLIQELKYLNSSLNRDVLASAQYGLEKNAQSLQQLQSEEQRLLRTNKRTPQEAARLKELGGLIDKKRNQSLPNDNRYNTRVNDDPDPGEGLEVEVTSVKPGGPGPGSGASYKAQPREGGGGAYQKFPKMQQLLRDLAKLLGDLPEAKTIAQATDNQWNQAALDTAEKVRQENNLSKTPLKTQKNIYSIEPNIKVLTEMVENAKSTTKGKDDDGEDFDVQIGDSGVNLTEKELSNLSTLLDAIELKVREIAPSPVEQPVKPAPTATDGNRIIKTEL